MAPQVRNTLILAVAAIAAATGFYVGFLRPNPPPEVAKEQADALLQRDADALWAITDPAEIQALGWTREKAGAFLNRFVFPVFADLRLDKKRERPTSLSGGDQGRCVVVLRTPEGHRFELETIAQRDASRAYAPLEALIVQAWFLRYMKRHNVDFSMGMWIPARAEGLREDRSALEALGLRGMYVGPDTRSDYDRAADETHGRPNWTVVRPWSQIERELAAARG